jgi:hypothetical protein
MTSFISRAVESALTGFLSNVVEISVTFCAIALIAVIAAVDIQARHGKIEWNWPGGSSAWLGCTLAVLVLSLLSALPQPLPNFAEPLATPLDLALKNDEYIVPASAALPIGSPPPSVLGEKVVDAAANGPKPIAELQTQTACAEQVSSISTWSIGFCVVSPSGGTISISMTHASNQLWRTFQRFERPVASALPLMDRATFDSSRYVERGDAEAGRVHTLIR